MSSPTLLQQLTEHSGRLYSLPSVALEVLELTAQPQVDSHALKACIENDPALTSKLLKTVNSSLFGLTRKVNDLGQAIALLGHKPLKMLVLGFSLPKELCVSLETPALSRYWRHALIKAVACRELAEQLWRRPGDDAFIAGLLQDIGQLVLVVHVGEPYVRFLDQAYTTPRPLTDLELESLGFDHTILSARLLEKWGLASSLVHVVAQPAETASIAQLPENERTLGQILHLGELLTRLLTRLPGTTLDDVLAVGVEYRDLDYHLLQEIVDSLEEKVVALGEVLSLYQPDGPPFCDILSQAHAQLSELAEAAGLELSRNALPESYLLGETRRLSEELKTALAGSSSRAKATGDSLRKSGPLPRNAASSAGGTAVLVETGLALRVQTALARARESRRPVSLLVVQIDHFADLVFTQGLERASWIERYVRSCAADMALERNGTCEVTGEATLAIICSDCDRREATDAARELLAEIKGKQAKDGSDNGISLSVGLATVAHATRNFPTQELITAAERCLYAAQAGGGQCVKSIEL